MKVNYEEAEQTTHETKRYMTMNEIRARFANVSRATIYDWINKCDFPKPYIKPSKTSFWLLTDIEEWEIKQNERYLNDDKR